MLLYQLLNGPVRPFLVNRPPFVGAPALLDVADRTRVCAGEHWVINEAVELMYARMAQEHWGAEDFDDLRPDEHILACEFDTPTTIKSAVRGPRDFTAAPRGRVLVHFFRAQMPPHSAGTRAVREGDSLLVGQMFLAAEAQRPDVLEAQALLWLDVDGRLQPWSPREPFRVMVTSPGYERRPLPADVGTRVAHLLEFGVWTACFALNAFNVERAGLRTTPALDAAWAAARVGLGVAVPRPKELYFRPAEAGADAG